MRSLYTAILFSVAAALGLSSAGCSSDTDAAPASAVVEVVTAPRPLRACVAQDKSGSSGPNATAQLTLDDLRPLIEAVSSRGGEVMLLVIDAAANEPAVRLYVPPPPAAAPAVPEGDPFLMEEALMARRAAEAALNAHRVAVDSIVAVFEAEAVPLLALPASADATDLNGALARCYAALGEPSEGWLAPPRNVAMAVSDAQDTAGNVAATVPDSVEVVLVNALPDLGSLEGVPGVVRFEGAAAAIRHITRAP